MMDNSNHLSVKTIQYVDGVKCAFDTLPYQKLQIISFNTDNNTNYKYIRKPNLAFNILCYNCKYNIPVLVRQLEIAMS